MNFMIKEKLMLWISGCKKNLFQRRKLAGYSAAMTFIIKLSVICIKACDVECLRRNPNCKL